VFDKSQRFYDAVYSFKDYPAEVERLRGMIEARLPEARTLLDVACGTGKHLELLRDHYEVEGADVDPEMLEIARARLGPDVPLHQADMLELDLGRTFDVVTCLFSSIAYASTPEDLRTATSRLAAHAAPGGLVLVEPFIPREQWLAGQVHAVFVDEPDLKIARMSVSESVQDVMTLRFHYQVATPDGVDRFDEEHLVGMFDRAGYEEAMRAAGLEVEYDAQGLMERGVYIGRKHP
jgi:ubiquinone/menaquinone biosynthesis C-methylase UbiE